MRIKYEKCLRKKKNITDIVKDLTVRISCLTVRISNRYTGRFSVLGSEYVNMAHSVKLSKFV